MINETPKPVVLDGTTGGELAVDPNQKGLQFAISGRATGIISVTVKGFGSDVFEEFTPAIDLDLSIDRTVKVEGFAASELKFTPNTAGGDFTVTIAQWPK